MRAAALTANRSVRELEEQARRFQPELAVLMEEDAAADLKVRLADTGVTAAAVGRVRPRGPRRIVLKP